MLMEVKRKPKKQKAAMLRCREKTLYLHDIKMGLDSISSFKALGGHKWGIEFPCFQSFHYIS